MEASYSRLSELEKRDKDLELKISKLNTTSGLEEEIRSKFSVSKNNENTVIIVREESSSSTDINTSTTFWSKIKAFFQ